MRSSSNRDLYDIPELSDDKINESLMRWKQNEILYHYTSLDTLHKLLSNIQNIDGEQCFSFWASELFFMNDPKEIILGFDNLIDILDKVEKEIRVEDNNEIREEYCLSSFCRQAINSGRNMHNVIKDNLCNSPNVPFAISLSKNNDSLPMWRSYGNNGLGVNLGFSQLSLESCQHNKYCAYDVSYDVKFCDTLEPFIKKAYYAYLKKTHTEQITLDYKIQIILIMAFYICPMIKQNAYAFENEWRIVINSVDKNDVKFRVVQNKTIIPYCEFYIPIKNLKEITIGPSLNFKEIRRCLAKELESVGVSKNIIKESKIAFVNFN